MMDGVRLPLHTNEPKMLAQQDEEASWKNSDSLLVPVLQVCRDCALRLASKLQEQAVTEAQVQSLLGRGEQLSQARFGCTEEQSVEGLGQSRTAAQTSELCTDVFSKPT